MDLVDSSEDVEINEATLTPEELGLGIVGGAKIGNLELIKACVDKGGPVDFEDHRSWSAIHYASYEGYTEIVDFLLEHGAAAAYRSLVSSCVQAGTSKFICLNSPLHWAVLCGHIRVVFSLLRAGYNVNDVDQYGNTSLHLAMRSRAAPSVQLEIVKALMSFGFDPSYCNWMGQTPLDMLPSSLNQVRVLIKSAISQNTCASTGTPFGSDQLRYYCHSSGKFFCEEASTSVVITAFVPRIPGVTVTPQSESPKKLPIYKKGDISIPLDEKFEWTEEYKELEVGQYGLFLAESPRDTSILRPVRYGQSIHPIVEEAERLVDKLLCPEICEGFRANLMSSLSTSSDQDLSSPFTFGTGEAISLFQAPENEGNDDEMELETNRSLGDTLRSTSNPLGDAFSLSQQKSVMGASLGSTTSKLMAPLYPNMVDQFDRFRGVFTTSTSANRLSSCGPMRGLYQSPVEVFFTAPDLCALEEALVRLRSLRGNPGVILRGLEVLNRARAAHALRTALLDVLASPAALSSFISSADSMTPNNEPGSVGYIETIIREAKEQRVHPLLVESAVCALRCVRAVHALAHGRKLAARLQSASHNYDALLAQLRGAQREFADAARRLQWLRDANDPVKLAALDAQLQFENTPEDVLLAKAGPSPFEQAEALAAAEAAAAAAAALESADPDEKEKKKEKKKKLTKKEAAAAAKRQAEIEAAELARKEAHEAAKKQAEAEWRAKVLPQPLSQEELQRREVIFRFNVYYQPDSSLLDALCASFSEGSLSSIEPVLKVDVWTPPTSKSVDSADSSTQDSALDSAIVELDSEPPDTDTYIFPVLSSAETLDRLQTEVSLGDLIAEIDAKIQFCQQTNSAYLEVSPLTFPLPSPPPVPVEEAANAPPPSAKGQKPGAASKSKEKPNPKEKEKGKSTVVAGGETPLPMDPAYPTDSAGQPIPLAPQLVAIHALRGTVEKLDALLASPAAEKAADLAVSAAKEKVQKGKEIVMELLLAERVRTDQFVEAAKKKKKKKKAKK